MATMRFEVTYEVYVSEMGGESATATETEVLLATEVEELLKENAVGYGIAYELYGEEEEEREVTLAAWMEKYVSRTTGFVAEEVLKHLEVECSEAEALASPLINVKGCYCTCCSTSVSMIKEAKSARLLLCGTTTKAAKA